MLSVAKPAPFAVNQIVPSTYPTVIVFKSAQYNINFNLHMENKILTEVFKERKFYIFAKWSIHVVFIFHEIAIESTILINHYQWDG